MSTSAWAAAIAIAISLPLNILLYGGSTGNLKEILDVLLAKNPHVRIVANAVTMETAAELSEAAKAFSYSEICCVNVSRGRKMGRYHLMTAQNPVYIVAMQN